MSTLGQVALAESVAEAEEIQDILRSAGIDAELETAVEHHPRAVEDAPQKVLVPGSDLDAARDARQSLTAPDEPPRLLPPGGAERAGRRVLDGGWGTGRFLAQLAEIAKAWGVDASPELLGVARTRAGGAGLKLGTAEELPLKDRS